MTTALVPGHIETAKTFLARSKGYLEQGDLHQASEKGWGAAAQIAKAAAEKNGWVYATHRQFSSIISNAGHKYRQASWSGYGDAAEVLHQFFYDHPSQLNADAIRTRIDKVEMLVEALVPFLVE